MTFVPAFEVAKLRGAPYNPRAIDADAIERLCHSLRTIGFAKPIIVCEDGLTVAGHQRTRAARACGMEAVPAWVLKSITQADEIRFNQLHNGTDLDQIDHPVFVPVDEPGVFVDVPASEVMGNLRSKGAVIRTAICKLIAQYGPWGCAVVGPTGEVISSPQYALACLQLGIPCRAYRVPAGTEQAARSAFAQSYGVFSYDHIQRQTWLQTYAQPMRCRGGRSSNDSSVLYDAFVLPSLQRHERLLDFGCGQGDYVKMLKSTGFRAFGVEFYRRRENSIDTEAVHAMIDQALAELGTGGRFDVVVLDSVITSTDTEQAAQDVLATVGALARPGGRVYMAGRRRERLDEYKGQTIMRDTTRYFEFLDSKGMTAIWRRDGWFFQRFYTHAEARTMAETSFGPVQRFDNVSNNWQVESLKRVELAPAVVEDALRREFDLPWPEGQHVGRGEQAVAAWRAALALEAEHQ